MLYFVTGRLGSGKTTFIHNEIKSQIEKGETGITLIVPEQASFATEKSLLLSLGANRYGCVDVLSFSRLADKLCSEKIKSGKALLDDPSKAALMGLALDSVKDKLTLYSKNTSQPGTVNAFLQVFGEAEQACVTPDELRNVAKSLDENLLKAKLLDIALICEAYETAKSKSYFDSADKLNLLIDEIRENHYFRNKLVYIDGFRGFTALQMKIIEQMLIDARAVYVTLCMERPDTGEDDELFSHTADTRRRLLALAKKAGVGAAKPLNESMGNKYNNFPPDIKRFASPELEALEMNLFDSTAPVYEEDCSAITVCKAPDIYAECDMIACLVKKEIRENGYRCRDIAIVARESDDYELPMRSALQKYGIACFEDSRHPVWNSPAVSAVVCAFTCASQGYSTETVMRFLKTGITSLTDDEINLLDDYTYMWQITGKRWLTDWQEHPRGFGFRFEETDKEELEKINEIRKKAVAPLRTFCGKVEFCTAEAAAKAAVEMLLSVNAPENIKELASRLDSAGNTLQADETARCWDILMQLLNSFASAAGERSFNATELLNLISLMLNVEQVGEIPSTIDEVVFGGADRIRLNQPKIVFIAGANQGVFPAVKDETPPFTFKDRQVLSENGIELASFGEYELKEEKLIAYQAFCCAREKLFVCCHSSDLSGSESVPSELYERICALFPKHGEVIYEKMSGLDFIESRQTAFEQLSKEIGEKSALSKAVEKYFENDTEYAGRMDALHRALNGRSFEIKQKENAEKLFGRSMTVSASRAEKYYGCPFEYFCLYGMNAKKRKPAAVDNIQRGTIIHYALEKLLEGHRGDSFLNLGDDELKAAIAKIFSEYLEEFLGGEQGKTTSFMKNYELIAKTVFEIAKRLMAEFEVCRFRPVDFELQIGKDGKIPGYTLKTEDGETVTVEGKVDRVDLAELENGKYIRIIDYKSGRKDFKLNEALNGKNIQMLIYLFAIWQSPEKVYGNVEPAGVIYFRAAANEAEAQSGDDEETILKNKYNVKNKGIVLDSLPVIEAMDSTYSNCFVPVRVSKSGKVSGSVISMESLKKLNDYIDFLLVDMANRLRNGRIEAYPLENECDYCDYKAVCSLREEVLCRPIEDRMSVLDCEVSENG